MIKLDEGGDAETLAKGLEERFLETGHPKDITLIFCAGIGDGKERGLNRLAHPGLVKRIIGGHVGLTPKLGQMILPQLEQKAHGVEVVGMMFFDDNTFLLRKGDRPSAAEAETPRTPGSASGLRR